MGCVASQELPAADNGRNPSPKPKPAFHSKEIDRQLRYAEQKEREKLKVLLLGTGESGKTTLIRQLCLLYGEGFSDKEKREYALVIRLNVVQALQALCGGADMLHAVDSASEELLAAKDLVEDTEHIKNDNWNKLSPEVLAAMRTLWAAPEIHTVTYGQRDRFQIIDSARYYLDKMDKIFAPSYMPSVADILRARAATTGIQEHSLVMNGTKFVFYDVGGQRNERKKWIHCFEDVTAVIFVIGLSEYNQVLYEDDTQNRFEEALTVWEEISNNQWFTKSCLILFLNKADLFREKVMRVPMSLHVKGYPASSDYSYEKGLSFIRSELQKRCKGRTPYTHVTSATDSSQMKAVFEAVREFVIRKALAVSGLV